MSMPHNCVVNKSTQTTDIPLLKHAHGTTSCSTPDWSHEHLILYTRDVWGCEGCITYITIYTSNILDPPEYI